MTPYHHREATALVAAAWSALEDRPNCYGRADAMTLIRKAMEMLADETEESPPPPGDDCTVAVESDQVEWWPSVKLAALALGVSRPSVSKAMADGQRTCVGRRLWRSKHATRPAFLAGQKRTA